MNGAKKFHSPAGPAFNPGEIWIGSSGSKVKILTCSCDGDEPSPGTMDYEVVYEQHDGSVASKDAWNFQVRYQHIADVHL